MGEFRTSAQMSVSPMFEVDVLGLDVFGSAGNDSFGLAPSELFTDGVDIGDAFSGVDGVQAVSNNLIIGGSLCGVVEGSPVLDFLDARDRGSVGQEAEVFEDPVSFDQLLCESLVINWTGVVRDITGSFGFSFGSGPLPPSVVDGIYLERMSLDAGMGLADLTQLWDRMPTFSDRFSNYLGSGLGSQGADGVFFGGIDTTAVVGMDGFLDFWNKFSSAQDRVS